MTTDDVDYSLGRVPGRFGLDVNWRQAETREIRESVLAYYQENHPLLTS